MTPLPPAYGRQGVLGLLSLIQQAVLAHLQRASCSSPPTTVGGRGLCLLRLSFTVESLHDRSASSRNVAITSAVSG